MVRCILFSGNFSSNSSLPNYQFLLSICERYDTTLVVNKKLDHEYKEINSSATYVHEFVGSSYFFPLYSLYIFIKCVITGQSYDLVVSGQTSIAILPAVLLRLTGKYQWILLSPDIPEGRIKVISKYEPHPYLTSISIYINYYIFIIFYRLSDITLLSDESSVLDTSKKSIIVTPGGADCSKTNIDRKNLDDNTPKDLTFVYVGNMHYHRGLDMILEAARELPHNIELKLIGPGPETAPHLDRNYLIESLGMSFEESVQFKNSSVECEYFGRLEHTEVLNHLATSDVGICILPTERMPHFEKAYAIKTFEYIAYSLAVIATDTEANRKVINDSRQLVGNSSSEIRSKMIEFCSNRELLNECQENNVKRSKEYCWSSVKLRINENLDAMEI